MASFHLPDLHMPYSARLNPHLAATRVHAKAWARSMGMIADTRRVAPHAWREADFDAHEFALLCAYTQPDLDAAELALMVDWYVWLFYFDDDFCHRFKRNRDYVGGEQFLASLWQYLPLEPDAAAPAPPDNPVTRGMADLWARTAPGTSAAWRRRFVGHVEDMLATAHWEHYTILHDRVANPLEYVAMRRMVGGCVWAACLVERALGLTLSDELLASRPGRIIHEAFADCEHIHNDLMSYSREIDGEGERANMVLVLERFFGIAPQAAAERASDLIAARLHQFEHALVVELPRHCATQGVSARERADLLRYAQGVIDWIAGAYEWHFQSSRYDLARRFAAPGQHGQPSYLGPTGLSADAERLLEQHGVRSRLAQGGLGSRERPTARALVAPPPSAHSHALLVWQAALAQLERELEQACELELALRAATQLRARLLAPGSATASTDVVSADAATLACCELLGRAWATLLDTTDAPTLAACRAALLARIDVLVWRVDHVVHDRAPDPIDHCEMRRRGDPTLALLELERPLPPALRSDRFVAQLRDAFADVIVLESDLWAHARDARPCVDAICVMQRCFGGSVAQAVVIVEQLATARRVQLEHLATHHVGPRVAALDDATQAAAARWLAGVREVLSHSSCPPRYPESSPDPWPHQGDDTRTRAFLARTRSAHRLLGAAPDHPQVQIVDRLLDRLDAR